MNLNLRIVLAGILSVTLGLLGTISISDQGQQPATVQPIPNEPMFSTIMRVAEKYSASIGDAGWLRGPDGKNDFFHCGGGPSDILAEDDPYYGVTDLAVFIVVVSRHLKAEGTYPVAAPYLNRLIKYGDAETMRINPKSRHSDSWKDDNGVVLENMAHALNRSLHRRS
jgi:hypothetical protein